MTKKYTKIAKILFKKSLSEKELLDAGRVHRLLTSITKAKPQGLTSILKAYKRLIEVQIKKEQVEIESAQNIKNSKLEKQILKTTGAKRIVFKTNPALVMGAKITHGDWVWEETLDSKLAQLTMNDQR